MDVVVVGAGFFGATVSQRLAESGLSVRLIEKRPHVGGNCFSSIDAETGIECHQYGSHIFHTSNEKVWHYLKGFTEFNQYRHTVWTTYKNHVYSMPINLHTINSYYGLALKPFEVDCFIRDEIAKESLSNLDNLEAKVISMIGRPLYEAFIHGYTMKQWEKDPKELAADIITRLPVRHNYDIRYFSDTYEGVPVDGYTSVVERMLDHPNITVELGCDYFEKRNGLPFAPTLYTGAIDRFFDYEFGHLDWRTIEFVRDVHEVQDYQGCSVMNYADAEIPFTRIHEFKHFHPERSAMSNTVTFTEYSRLAGLVDDPYYPVNTPRNRCLLAQYQGMAQECENIWFGGRLGAYRYFDIDDTIDAALDCADAILHKLCG